MAECEDQITVHSRVLARLRELPEATFAIATVLNGEREWGALLVKTSRGIALPATTSEMVLSGHVFNAPDGDVMLAMLFLEAGKPLNLLVDPGSRVLRQVAELLLEAHGDGYLVALDATSAVRAWAIADLSPEFQAAMAAFSEGVLATRHPCRNFKATSSELRKRTHLIGTWATAVELSANEALSPLTAPSLISVNPFESSYEPQWQPLENLPMIANLVNTELENDREILAFLQRSRPSDRAIACEEKERLRSHLREQQEFNALHREQIEQWRLAVLRPGERSALQSLEATLDELDEVLAKGLKLAIDPQ